MLFKYFLSDEQYTKLINQDKIKFANICTGTLKLVKCTPIGTPVKTFHSSDHWECWIDVQSKPWWLPFFILNWGFKKSLFK